MKIQKILILVELEDGSVRQVLSSKEKKHLMLNFLTAEDGSLKVSEKIEPIELKFHTNEA